MNVYNFHKSVCHNAQKPRWCNRFEVYPLAVRQFRFPTVREIPKCVQDGIYRGSINGFSRHSALRLREFLATRTLRGSLRGIYGITLTVPWRSLSLGSSLCAYRSAFNRFGLMFRRRFPNSYLVFRHELQIRRMPHCHCVLYLSCRDVDSDLLRLFGSMWLISMSYQSYGGDWAGFSRHGVDVQTLTDCTVAYRYIADHASKHKRSQLGYIGKQWGVLGRSNVVAIIPDELVFPSLELRNAFFRTISKICRFRIKDSRCPFGSYLSRKVYTRSISYVGALTCRRLYDAMILNPARFSRHTADSTLAFHLVLRSML